MKAFLAGRTRPAAVLKKLNELEETVTGPIERVQKRQAGEVKSALSAADASKHDALIAALLGGLLAIGGVAAFAFAAVRLIRRTTIREARLAALVTQTRSSIGALGEVAQELRAAAQEAEATTAEQSAAITETSATIEEFAVTATSIADNARAVAGAAEQTGDTMRDMQEKVETIAERSLSLGERSQKIGEILRAHQRDRRADQPARAQRGDRGSARRRGRPRVRGRRRRGAQAGRALDRLDRVDPADHRLGPGRDELDDHGDRAGHAPGARGR